MQYDITQLTGSKLFFENAQKWADRPRFMVQEGGQWQPVLWTDYRENVERIAHAIKSIGLSAGDKVGIYCDNRLEWIYAGFGILTSQTVVIPIYHATTVEQGTYIVSHSDLKLLFVQNKKLLDVLFSTGDRFPELKNIVLLEGEVPAEYHGRPCFSLEEFYRAGEAYREKYPGLLETLLNSTTGDMVAQMYYTSGTTGNPKGVPLTYENLAYSSRDWLAINGHLIDEGGVDLHWLPTSHIFGWGEVGLGNILGFTSYMTNPKDVLSLLSVYRPHLFFSVPLYYEKLYTMALTSSDNEEAQLAKLRELTGGRLQFLLSGGAGLKREVKDFFLKAGLWITEGYGLTECSPTLTMNRHDAFHFDSVGKPYPSVQIKLAEDDEILANGPVVFKGYYKDPEATAKCFTDDGWFRTGDCGRWLDGGYLQIIGRKKEIIVTAGGKNIPPENIERLFVDNPCIEHLVVYGDGKKFVTALVTLAEVAVKVYLQSLGRQIDDWDGMVTCESVRTMVEEAVENANASLARYETIRKFLIVPEHFTPMNGLMTPSLKVRRKEVYKRFGEALDDLYEQAARERAASKE